MIIFTGQKWAAEAEAAAQVPEAVPEVPRRHGPGEDAGAELPQRGQREHTAGARPVQVCGDLRVSMYSIYIYIYIYGFSGGAVFFTN